MNKLTKIIATIGPSTDSPDMIAELIRAGVNIFRFNFKHNSVAWHNERIQRVNNVSEHLGIPVGTLIDLQGPEIRINMPTESIMLAEDERIIFGEEVYENKSTQVKGLSITHPEIISHLKNGQRIVAADGEFTFTFERVGGKQYLISHNEGVLPTRKTLNIPGADFPFPVLIDRDFEGLELAAASEIDFIALSFVRTVEDLQTVRREMKKYKVPGKLVAKIETQKAIDNIDAIIAASDAVMVARGDLGVELPVEQVPFYQKLIIRKCIEHTTPVITATQMLKSMTAASYPTRAEVSDIGNAAYDLTDAVMLSEETAMGAYPLETVELMSRTVAFNEAKFHHDQRRMFEYTMNTQAEIIADAAYNMYLSSGMTEKVQGFVVFTNSGATAHLVSRYRPQVPIFAFTKSKQVADSLTLDFGVTPIIMKNSVRIGSPVTTEKVLTAVNQLVREKLLVKGKKIIALHGDTWSMPGSMSTVKIVRV